MRMADRRPSKNVNDIPNGKLINILTEKYLKRAVVERDVFTSKIIPMSAKINEATAYEVR